MDPEHGTIVAGARAKEGAFRDSVRALLAENGRRASSVRIRRWLSWPPTRTSPRRRPRRWRRHGPRRPGAHDPACAHALGWRHHLRPGDGSARRGRRSGVAGHRRRRGRGPGRRAGRAAGLECRRPPRRARPAAGARRPHEGWRSCGNAVGKRLRGCESAVPILRRSCGKWSHDGVEKLREREHERRQGCGSFCGRPVETLWRIGDACGKGTGLWIACASPWCRRGDPDRGGPCLRRGPPAWPPPSGGSRRARSPPASRSPASGRSAGPGRRGQGHGGRTAFAPRRPRWQSGSARLAGAAAVLVFAVATLRQFLWLGVSHGTSVTQFNPYDYGDLPLHWSYVSFFAEGASFWPQNPIFAGAPLSYPIGSDLLAALFVKLGADTGLVFRVTGVVATVAAGVALRRWGGALRHGRLRVLGRPRPLPLRPRRPAASGRRGSGLEERALVAVRAPTRISLRVACGASLAVERPGKVASGPRRAALVDHGPALGSLAPLPRPHLPRGLAGLRGLGARSRPLAGRASRALRRGTPGHFHALSGDRWLQGRPARLVEGRLDDRQRESADLPAPELRPAASLGDRHAPSASSRRGRRRLASRWSPPSPSSRRSSS